MEAVVNTVRGLWQPQDHKTISQKSLLGRSPACSFHAWRCAATKRSTCRELFEITFSRREKLTVVCKNGASKVKSPCTSSDSFKTESDIKKSSRHALRKALLYLLEQAIFSGFISEAYFWLEKCEHEARSYTCHSPRSILLQFSLYLFFTNSS